ncbi:MAG: DUF4407 domain-containing protein [Pyrinomonadaceae bacterium]|nr:DUF4407 domain-containing protein [Pyrinomonadaceae bacterium]
MNTTHQNQSSGNVKSVRQFFWWAAGIVIPVMEKCPTEQIKYTAIGVMMFFISLLASVSFAFFLSYTFDSATLPALFGGLIWGGLIFCLDRVVLTSFRKGETGILSIALRFALVISTSFVIGEPLLLHLFRKEINLELVNKGRAVVTNARREVTARYQDETDALLNADNELQTRLDTLKNDRDAKENAVIGEVEGTAGSGKKGDGIAAKRKDAAFKEADAKYTAAKAESAEILQQNKNRLAEIRTEIENQTKLTNAAETGADGILARHEALFSIIKNNAGAATVYIPLFAILLLLETLPLTSKVIGKKGVYDNALEAVEAGQITEIQERREFERESLVRSREVQKAIAERLSVTVINGEIENLHDENEIRVARILQAEALRMTENEVFNRQAAAFETADFAGEIIVEVVGHEDFAVSLHIPKNAQKMLSLKNLSGDINKIAAAIGEKLQLSKAFSSANREISVSLPLLAQLENDCKMLLEFRPIGES